MQMDLPTHLVNRINTGSNESSCIYTITQKNLLPGFTTTIDLPYSENVTWLHYKYAWTGGERLQFFLQFLDVNGVGYSLSPPIDICQREWHDLTFPIPAVLTSKSYARLVVKTMNDGGGNNGSRSSVLQIELLGFSGIYARDGIYIFMSENGNIKYELAKSEPENIYKLWQTGQTPMRPTVPIYTAQYYGNRQQ